VTISGCIGQCSATLQWHKHGPWNSCTLSACTNRCDRR